MRVVSTIKDLQLVLQQHQVEQKKLGFVPTMGALHQGHLSLIASAKAICEVVICSIFVNPTQFNKADDLAKYPRTIANDTELLLHAGCDILFCPEVTEMYASKTQIRFDFGPLENILEGAFRPGHFNGVGIVVAKLFNIVQPDHAFFGQKDLQQFAVIKTLVNDLSFQLTLHCCAIIRESDGLAMSSRNTRLNKNQRALAPIIFKSLQLGESLLKNKKTIPEIYEEIAQLYTASAIQLEYYQLVDPNNLTEIKTIQEGQKVAICVACYIDDIRLIDNIIFNA
jgi:pantoate--beta-alanine ligase